MLLIGERKEARRRCAVAAGVLCLMVFAAGMPATVAADDAASGPSFFYDGAGKIGVTASTEEFTVRVKESAQRGVAGRPAFLPEANTPALMHPAAAKLELQMGEAGVHVVRGMSGAQLEAMPELEYALPVLYREGATIPIYQTPGIVVQITSDARKAELEALAESLDCDVQPLRRGENRYLLTVRDAKSTEVLEKANVIHERNDLAVYAHPNFYLPKITHAPPVIDDPIYHSHQWHLDGDVLKGAAPNSDINAEAAWDSDNGPNAQGSPTVHVAIVDDSVERLHPDLFPNWRTGLSVDQVPYIDDPSPTSGQRHGTACAGLAVAKGNNIGVRGVCPDCGLIGVKFFGGTLADTANAYLFLIDPDTNGFHDDGAAVVSNSWSYVDGTLQPPDVVNAINMLATQGRDGKGVLVLFASGNNDHTVNGVSALAQLATTMAIGGTNSNAQHTEFSDVGPEIGFVTPTNDRGDDGVRFPWLDITTTDNTGASGYNGLPDLDYTNQFGGTSAATPIAAGVLALVLSQDETMTAAQVRAIVQHTAVRIDEPYGRFDPVTGHSHRYGFGRADVGAAVAAAVAGMRWPDRIKTLSLTPLGNDIGLVWSSPPNDYAGSLLVRSSSPFAWMPEDGVVYNVSDVVTNGVTVVYKGATPQFTDVNQTTGGYFYGVYPFSTENLYGFGARANMIRNGVIVFQDNSEGVDPGWTHGGPGDEWARGIPTSANATFSQSVSGSGPLAGTRGVRAIGGNRCWGTDLQSTYAPNANAYLQTPLINLTGVNVPVYLEYWDWCLLETFYDKCTVEVVDQNDDFLGFIDPETGGDYDWTHRAYDISAFSGQPIKIRFRLISDSTLQRDGWFIDDVKVTIGDNIPLPPTAKDVYVETPENALVPVVMSGTDPNVGTTLVFRVISLPSHGTLHDPNGGAIGSAPYSVLSNGNILHYQPDLDYQGPDSFTYLTFDGGLESNLATVTISVGTPVVIYDFPLNTDPGWLREGQWAFGVPLGSGGDPTSGFTGSNVFGYNLAGAYPNNLPPRYLTTLPLNCTGLTRVTLDFARWLGIEAGNFDNASIEVTADGVDWVSIWKHTGGNLQETSWSQQTYNISAIADDQPFVQIRWVMGPTDTNTTFSGWNLDDIRIRAIGDAPTNLPPLAKPVTTSVAKNDPVTLTLDGSDEDGDPIEYVIVELPANGELSDPNGGVIAAVPYTLLNDGDMVEYMPDTDFAGVDTFKYQVNDGDLNSNVSTATVTVLDPAPFPYFEDFESGGPLDIHWEAKSTNAGRIRFATDGGPIGNYHLLMDSGAAGIRSANQVTLVVNLEGQSSVLLKFDWKEFGDETHILPSSFVGDAEGDGVAISQDGIQWYKVADMINGGSFYQNVLIDLDQAIASFGISYNSTFRIRFHQVDDQPFDVDGIAVDNIQVVQGTDEPLILTAALPTGEVGTPYGPEQIETIGGDLPLVWSMPIEFFEVGLGPNGVSAGGVAQNLHGDDVFMDYNLPFSFPFYGVHHAAVRIGSDGWINFGPHVGSTWNNSTAALQANVRIAVMWDDLRTDIGTDGTPATRGDIYIDESTPGRVTIRWDAVTRTAGNQPCNFSATLFDDGAIRLDYGSGNTPLTPTVGVSAGDGRYFLASHDAAANLGDAESLLLDFGKLPPGLTMDANGVVSGTPTKGGSYQALIVIDDQRNPPRTDSKMIPVTVLTNVFGDIDQDGDADLDDYAMFAFCMENPPPLGECVATFDVNGNEIMDLEDFAAFQVAFTGP